MSTALVPFSEVREMAAAAVSSRLFSDIKTPEAALTLMLLCQAEGLHPITALRRYHIINGKPALKADAMLGDFMERGGKVTWKTTTDAECEGVFMSPAMGAPVAVKWTMADAKRAGLTSNPTWSKYPRQMLRARVISEGIRLAMPSVVAGVYTPEEVQDFEPPKNGKAAAPVAHVEVIDVIPEPAKATEPAPVEPTDDDKAKAFAAELAKLQGIIYMRAKDVISKDKAEVQDWIERTIGRALETHTLQTKKGAKTERTIKHLDKETCLDVLQAIEDHAKAMAPPAGAEAAQ
jgi:hypothetical protein